MFDMVPGYYARYRNAAGEAREMRHYNDDAAVWTDSRGVVWTRTAITTQRHLTTACYQAELDRLETREAQ